MTTQPIQSHQQQNDKLDEHSFAYLNAKPYAFILTLLYSMLPIAFLIGILIANNSKHRDWIWLLPILIELPLGWLFMTKILLGKNAKKWFSKQGKFVIEERQFSITIDNQEYHLKYQDVKSYVIDGNWSEFSFIAIKMGNGQTFKFKISDNVHDYDESEKLRTISNRFHWSMEKHFLTNVVREGNFGNSIWTFLLMILGAIFILAISITGGIYNPHKISLGSIILTIVGVVTCFRGWRVVAYESSQVRKYVNLGCL